MGLLKKSNSDGIPQITGVLSQFVSNRATGDGGVFHQITSIDLQFCDFFNNSAVYVGMQHITFTIYCNYSVHILFLFAFFFCMQN